MFPQFRVSLGRNVCKLRMRLSLTQEALAARIGMDRGYLARIEMGRARVSLEKLFDIARGLGVKLEELLQGCSGFLPVGRRGNGRTRET